MSDILRSDNHELFDHVRVRLVARNPVIPFEDIAAEFGVTVDELVGWFLSYRLPKVAIVMPTPRGVRLPRDPELRAELQRLRRREESLVTVANEAPAQLEVVQRRIASLEKTH
jgi:hypothetical protein